jgi:hypothetical protein
MEHEDTLFAYYDLGKKRCSAGELAKAALAHVVGDVTERALCPP